MDGPPPFVELLYWGGFAIAVFTALVTLPAFLEADRRRDQELKREQERRQTCEDKQQEHGHD